MICSHLRIIIQLSVAANWQNLSVSAHGCDDCIDQWRFQLLFIAGFGGKLKGTMSGGGCHSGRCGTKNGKSNFFDILVSRPFGKDEFLRNYGFSKRIAEMVTKKVPKSM